MDFCDCEIVKSEGSNCKCQYLSGADVSCVALAHKSGGC